MTAIYPNRLVEELRSLVVAFEQSANYAAQEGNEYRYANNIQSQHFAMGREMAFRRAKTDLVAILNRNVDVPLDEITPID